MILQNQILVIPASEPESIKPVALELKLNLEFNSGLLVKLHRLPALVLMDSGSGAGMTGLLEILARRMG